MRIGIYGATGYTGLELISWLRRHREAEIVFATSRTYAGKRLSEALATGTRVIDLSNDFRLRDAAVYERWFKHAHGAPELLEQAVYGLPELYREQITDARLVGNPGCYPTSVILGLLP